MVKPRYKFKQFKPPGFQGQTQVTLLSSSFPLSASWFQSRSKSVPLAPRALKHLGWLLTISTEAYGRTEGAAAARAYRELGYLESGEGRREALFQVCPMVPGVLSIFLSTAEKWHFHCKPQVNCNLLKRKSHVCCGESFQLVG